MNRINRTAGLIGNLKPYADDLLDQCESLMATDESFRRRILKLALYYGKGKRGTLRVNIHPLQLEAEFKMAAMRLRKGVGPMRRITQRQMAEYLIANLPHHKGKDADWLIKQRPR